MPRRKIAQKSAHPKRRRQQSDRVRHRCPTARANRTEEEIILGHQVTFALLVKLQCGCSS